MNLRRNISLDLLLMKYLKCCSGSKWTGHWVKPARFRIKPDDVWTLRTHFEYCDRALDNAQIGRPGVLHPKVGIWIGG